MYKLGVRGGSVEASFREVALSQLDEVLAQLAASDADRREVVHGVRRRCKKLRALLRLVRPAFPAYRGENAALRDAAALLSHLRDADVQRQTVEALARCAATAADAELLHRVAARLTEVPHDDTAAARLGQFRTALESVRTRAARWSLADDGPEPLLEGLRQTYRLARRRMKQAGASRAAADLHEWRKAAKSHGFHVDLLRKLAPDLLIDDLKAIDALSLLLGEHHDLAMLDAAIAATPARFGEAADIEVLVAAIGRRRNDVESSAFGLGRQIFAERPRTVRDRFGAYWESAS
jgi:CHAD domain-containing protein